MNTTSLTRLGLRVTGLLLLLAGNAGAALSRTAVEHPGIMTELEGHPFAMVVVHLLSGGVLLVMLVVAFAALSRSSDGR